MRITANQVTFSRLVLMPFLAGMVYGDEGWRVAAVVLGTVLGITDTLDGYLARKHGPTVLGGLMDPIADKVFIAVGFIPYVDLGWIPWWLAALLFLREFLITGLRSSFETRRLTLKTSYLAKMKTWVQMAGLGVFLLALVLSRAAMLGFLVTCAVAPVFGFAIYRWKTGKFWRGALIGTAWFGAAAAMLAFGGSRVLLIGVLVALVGVTWISGIDYLAVAWRDIGLRGLKRFDLVRVAGAVALPFTAIAALVHAGAPAWAVIGVLALELAVGGLDNLLAHHDVAAPAATWGTRVLGASALLGAALVQPAWATPLTVAALAAILVGTATSFVRNRKWYIDALDPGTGSGVPSAENSRPLGRERATP